MSMGAREKKDGVPNNGTYIEEKGKVSHEK